MKTIHIGERSGRGSGRVGSDFLSVIAGRVGSTFRRVGSSRVQEKWPVDNSDLASASVAFAVRWVLLPQSVFAWLVSPLWDLPQGILPRWVFPHRVLHRWGESILSESGGSESYHEAAFFWCFEFNSRIFLFFFQCLLRWWSSTIAWNVCRIRSALASWRWNGEYVIDRSTT